MFFFYNYLCAKNIVGKVTGIKFTSQQFKNYTITFDSFGAFFAIFTELFIYNIYYFETNKSAPFVVDCGANIGLAVFYIKYLYPQARVHCYEPDKETFAILEKNMLLNNFKDVVCLQEAVSDTVGEAEFYSFGNMQGGPGNTLEKSQVNFANVNSYKVPVVTLSSKNYDHVDFLKIDVEGAEGWVLRDIDTTGVLKKTDRISLEYHYDEAISHNTLSGILQILETNNMHTILNANILVGYYITKKKFEGWNHKYVLMLDSYKKDL